MKRDMDLIRRIAMAAEDVRYGHTLRGLEGVTPEDFFHHVRLMQEAGLLEASLQEYQDFSSPKAAVWRLTWAGHDFLDAARSDTIWAKAKSSILKPGMSFTFDLLKEWLKAEVAQGFPTLRG